MVIQEESSQAGLSEVEAELAALRLRIEAVNLRGLAGAAGALLGDHPAAVCEVLASWDFAQPGELPQLVDHYWAALAPLGVSVPAGPAPEALQGLLAGLHIEAQVAQDALVDCRDCADRVPVSPAHSPGGEALDGELWRRALVSALDDFWSLLTGICARVRLVLLEGGRAETVQFLEFERARLIEVTERIAALVSCVASTGWASPPPSSALGLAEPSAAPALPSRPLFIDLRPQTSAEDARRWLPIVFLVAVTGLAIVVLVMVASGSLPG